MHWPPFYPQKHHALSILIVKSSFFESDWMHSSPFHCSSLFFLALMWCLLFILKNRTKKLKCSWGLSSKWRMRSKVTDVIWRALNRPPWTPKLSPARWPCIQNPILGIAVWYGLAFLRVCVLGTPTHWGSIIKPPKIHNNSPTATCFFNSNVHNWCFTQCSKSQTTCGSLLLD